MLSSAGTELAKHEIIHQSCEMQQTSCRLLEYYTFTQDDISKQSENSRNVCGSQFSAEFRGKPRNFGYFRGISTFLQNSVLASDEGTNMANIGWVQVAAEN